MSDPIARLGWLWASVVGFVWGGIWSTGPVERHGRLWVFRGMPSWTFRRGGSCVGSCFLCGDIRITPALLRHESIHEQQWRRYGFTMPVRYLLAGADPYRNRFEIEAGLADGGYVRDVTAR